MKKLTVCLALVLAALVAAPLAAQGTGGGGESGHGGGGAGCGDVFGDLVHILRADTGQPILAQRWVENPGPVQGYGWGYCPIAVDANGSELGFAPLSCDVATVDADKVVEVDYFGRLSGGRTKERNSRMHFNEVISNIKDPETMSVGLDETGRLLLGYGCDAVGSTTCAEWAVIDSPMENLALYTRLMKYGHFQTDPLEVDRWAAGDPAAGTQYNPALTTDDWQKLQTSVRFLLPKDGSAFCDTGECVEPESLTYQDFVAAAAALGGAANKTGKITVDLVQYMNRILKITKDTEATLATADTLPALVRDCWASTEEPQPQQATDENGNPIFDDEGEPVLAEIQYDATCTVRDPDPVADGGYDLYPDVQEMFVDFGDAAYDRTAWRNNFVTVIGPLPADSNPLTLNAWVEVPNVSILGWLEAVNGAPPQGGVDGIDGFVAASSDTLRAIEFVHNYAVPVDLDWNFVSDAGGTLKIKLKK